MKKQTPVYYILAVCVAVVLGVVVYKLAAEKKNSTPKTGLNSDVIFECVPRDIMGFSVENEKEQYKITKTEEWQIEGLEDKMLDAKAVKDTVLLLSSVKGNKLQSLEDSPSFDKKAVIFTDNEKNGEESFFLGESDKKYYLKNSKGDVYEISQVFYSVAERSLDFYREKNLSQIKMFNESNFLSLEYKPGAFNSFKQNVVIGLKNEKEKKLFGEKSQYIMKTPFYKPVNTGSFDTKVIAKLSALKAEKFVTDKAEDLSDYGLDKKSRGEFYLKTDKGEFTLYIGTHSHEEELGEVYAMFEGETTVFTVLSTNVGFAFTDPFEYIEKNLFEFDFDYLNKAEIKYGEEKFVFENKQKKYYLNKKPISDSGFFEFEKELEKVLLNSETKNKQGSKILDIKVVLKENGVREYEIYKTENNKYILCENDFICYLEEKSVDDFISYLKELGGV